MAKLNEIETYRLPLNELVKHLKTDLERGLSRKDAEERLQIFGLNVIPKIKSGFFRTYIAAKGLHLSIPKSLNTVAEVRSDI